jgi:fumarate reductase flavoprotein subunit
MVLKKNALTRREFVKTAAVTAGGAALAGYPVLSANTANAASTQEPRAPFGKADETIETQIVVVGSGLGGLSAALTAVEEGATQVVVLEKNSVFGGGTNYAEVHGPGEATEAQAREAAASAFKSSNYIADPMLHYQMNIEKKENTDWLFNKHGVKYNQDGGPPFYEGGNGISCIKTLVAQAEARGIDLRLKTPALTLLLDDSYTCTGVRAKSEAGKVIDFKARAVVLATGGMSTDKSRLSEYTSIDLEKVIIDGVQSGQDGDGHKMAEQTAHGRATHLCISSLFLNIKGFAYSSPMGVCAGMQPTNLWVNQEGIRFVDESIVQNTVACNKAVEIQGNVYSIMDQKGFDRYAAGGCQTRYSGFADKLVANPIDDLADDFNRYKKLEDVFHADSLDGLARQMKIDAAAFKTTVARYNGYADTGLDDEWGKDVSNIWPIATAPFYGFRLSSGMLNTNGGVRINTNAQVVDPRYRVISGLYATGILTSGWCGETYLGGTCQPVALWGGRKAAKHIVSYLL